MKEFQNGFGQKQQIGVFIFWKSAPHLLFKIWHLKNLEADTAIDYFWIFGCIAYAHILDEKREQLDNKGEKCIFLGISEQSKAYKLFNPITGKIIICRDVIFN